MLGRIFLIIIFLVLLLGILFNKVPSKKLAAVDFYTYSVGKRTMRYVEVKDHPNKPLIIFVHGSPGEWGAWSKYLKDPDLVKQAHMIAVDRPGYGGSGGGQVEQSLIEQARDIAPLLDKAIPGQRLILVGHSFGGSVIARLAVDYGNRITDLLILAGSIDPDLEQTAWYQYLVDWPIFTWMIPNDLIVCNREIRALKNELINMRPLWGNITQRVTVIQGDNDILVPAANADFAQRVITHAQALHIIRLPKTGHFLPWKNYDLVKSQILELLK